MGSLEGALVLFELETTSIASSKRTSAPSKLPIHLARGCLFLVSLGEEILILPGGVNQERNDRPHETGGDEARPRVPFPLELVGVESCIEERAQCVDKCP